MHWRDAILSTCCVWTIVKAGSVPFILDYTFLPHYPFVVHDALNSTLSPPPAIVFLGGNGMRGDPKDIAALATYNGIGQRLAEYYNGDRNEHAVMVANQFMSIIPIAPDEEPEDGLFEWRIEHIRPIVERVDRLYDIDKSRVFLCAYSMGARGGWKLLAADTDYWTAAAISAGEPQMYRNLSLANLIEFPLRHYQGEIDYVSPPASALSTQQYFSQLGSTQVELIIVPNASHGDMGHAAFSTEMFTWLLRQTNDSNQLVFTTPLDNDDRRILPGENKSISSILDTIRSASTTSSCISPTSHSMATAILAILLVSGLVCIW